MAAHIAPLSSESRCTYVLQELEDKGIQGLQQHPAEMAQHPVEMVTRERTRAALNQEARYEMEAGKPKS